MPDSTRRYSALAALLAALACSEHSAPSGGAFSASLALAPVIELSASAAPLPIDGARVRVTRAARPADLVVDTLVAFPASAPSVSLQLRIELEAPSELLNVTVTLVGGSAVFYLGSDTVTVSSSRAGPTAMPPLTLRYVGPGADIATLRIAPRDSLASFGDSVRFRATGTTAAGAVITSFPIAWSTNDATAPMTDAGALRAPARRATIRVRAELPNGVRDSVNLTLVAVPSTMTVVGGAGQTARPNAPLATPITVEVRASDGLPVADVPIGFRSVTGGGGVEVAEARTDNAGRASTDAFLGPTLGEQRFEASTPGLAPVTITATAAYGNPASLVLADGGNQRGGPGSTLPVPLTVRVVDADDLPLPDVTVTFRALATGASVAPGSATTTEAGEASTTAQLGPGLGPQQFEASVAGLPALLITATAEVGAAAALYYVGGGAQTAVAGAPFQAPLSVRVTDAGGVGVSGATVSWQVIHSNGLVGTATSVSGSSGVATMTANAPARQGLALYRASLPNGANITFAGFGTTGPASQVAVHNGANQSIHFMSEELEVQVTDSYGNPVPGVMVQWTEAEGSGGTLVPSSSLSDSLGVARTSFLTPSNPSTSSRVRGTIGGGSFAEMLLLSDFYMVAFRGRTGPTAPVRVGSTPIAFTTQIADPSEAGLSNVATSWTVVRGGGVFSLPNTVTNTAGIASGQYAPGPLAGHHLIQAIHQVGVVPIPMRFAFRALPGLENRILMAAGDQQTVVAGSSLPEPLRALVVDQFNNPVSGVQVSWSLVGGGSLGTTTTDANGIATQGVTPNGTAGAREYRATVAGISAPATFTVYLLPPN